MSDDDDTPKGDTRENGTSKNDAPKDDGAKNDAPKKVGKGNPPVHTRFQKGHKGIGGRPAGRRNDKSLAQEAVAKSLLAIADEKHGLTLSGKKKRLSAIEIIFTQFKHATMSKGQLAAVKLFFDEYHRLQKIVSSSTKAEPYPFSDLDRQVINEMYSRMKLCEASELSDPNQAQNEADQRSQSNGADDNQPNQEPEPDDPIDLEFNRMMYGPGKKKP